MDSELDRTHDEFNRPRPEFEAMLDSMNDRVPGEWDEQSCREYEEFLDEVNGLIEDEDPPCGRLQLDVDLFDNRVCPLHGGF